MHAPRPTPSCTRPPARSTSAPPRVTSIARAAAPTRRIGSQFVGVAVLPPATCRWYFVVSSVACSMRTFFQSTSSSSAMSIGSIVFTPWPISGFFAMIVTMPSGVMRMNAFGANSAAGSARASASRRVARLEVASPSSRPPPASAVTRRNRGGDRRVSWCSWSRLLTSGRGVAGEPASPSALAAPAALVDRLADAQVGPAAADVAVHRRVDVRVGRLRRCARAAPRPT